MTSLELVFPPDRHAELADLAREVLTLGGCFRFRASGQSMCPFVRTGDLLSIEPEGHSPFILGEMVLYWDASRTGLTAHRIVGRGSKAGEPFWRIRGDRLWAKLELVPAKQVLGRVVAIERDKGDIRFLHRPWHRWPALMWIIMRPMIRRVGSGLSSCIKAP